MVDTAFRLFFRDKHGLFWGVAFPLMMMGLIGSVFGGGMGNLVLTTSVVYESNDPLAQGMVGALESVPTLQVIAENEAEALAALRKGDRSLVVVFPALAELGQAGVARAASGETVSGRGEDGFGEASGSSPMEALPVQVYYDDKNYEVAQAGIAIVGGIVDEFNKRLTDRVDVLRVDASGISAHQLSMFDFLLPGILAMVLMQTGLMGVTAVMTSYRERLLLKRVLATPFPPVAFLGGLVARFTVTNLLQGVIIVIVGVLVFGATVIGSYGNMFVLALIGSITFLSMGFAISTMSKTLTAPTPSAARCPFR